MILKNHLKKNLKEGISKSTTKKFEDKRLYIKECYPVALDSLDTLSRMEGQKNNIIFKKRRYIRQLPVGSKRTALKTFQVLFNINSEEYCCGIYEDAKEAALVYDFLSICLLKYNDELNRNYSAEQALKVSFSIK